MNAVRSFITYGLYPIHFSAGMIAAYVLWQRGHDPAVILAGITAVTVAVIVIAERINPYVKWWNESQNDVRTDLIHAVVSMITLPKLMEIGMRLVFVSVAASISAALGFSLWPTEWPIAGQLALVMLVSQFGEYWAHRLFHEVPALWRFHATHHSPNRLYWLNAARFHPIDTFAAQIVGNVPLLLLGAPESMYLLLLTWTAMHGLFQHCNIRLRLGPLNYIFSMAELHRWHHSLNLEEANTNYGNNIIFWDIVFGTMFYPRDREASEHIGLHDIKDFPQDYIGQVLSPFRWRKINGQAGQVKEPAPASSASAAQ